MPSVPDRLTAWGQQLVEVHDRLRDDLDRLLDGLDEHETLTPEAVRTHCVAFCSGGRPPPHAARTAPRSRPSPRSTRSCRDTLDGLARDHHVVADILQRIDAVLRTADDDPARARGEIDGLAAILESHFRWEERAIVSALDGLQDPTLTREDLFG